MGAILQLVCAILLALVAYLIAVAVGLPLVVAYCAAILGLLAGWMLAGAHR